MSAPRRLLQPAWPGFFWKQKKKFENIFTENKNEFLAN